MSCVVKNMLIPRTCRKGVLRTGRTLKKVQIEKHGKVAQIAPSIHTSALSCRFLQLSPVVRTLAAKRRIREPPDKTAKNAACQLAAMHPPFPATESADLQHLENP